MSIPQFAAAVVVLQITDTLIIAPRFHVKHCRGNWRPSRPPRSPLRRRRSSRSAVGGGGGKGRGVPSNGRGYALAVLEVCAVFPSAGAVAARAAGCRPPRPLPRPAHSTASGRGSLRPSLPWPARRPCRRPRVLVPLRAFGGRSHPPRGGEGPPPFPLPRPLSAGRAGAARRAAPFGRFPPAPPCLRRSLLGAGCRSLGPAPANSPPPRAPR